MVGFDWVGWDRIGLFKVRWNLVEEGLDEL